LPGAARFASRRGRSAYAERAAAELAQRAGRRRRWPVLEEADAESAREAGAGALITGQAGELTERVERLAVSASRAHQLVHDRKGSRMAAYRNVDRHARRRRTDDAGRSR